MTAGDLAPGTRFRQPATGLVGVVMYQSESGTAVRVDNRAVVVAVCGREFVRPAETVTWSAATAVEVVSSPEVAP